MPLRAHENILVFYRKLPTYNPQFSQGKPYLTKFTSTSKNYGKVRKEFNYRMTDGNFYPKDILPIKIYNHNKHSTQKPVELLRYLIRTYTNENEVVLDFCCGSGSTRVAAIQEKRQFIGIELDEHYFEIAQKRIAELFSKKNRKSF